MIANLYPPPPMLGAWTPRRTPGLGAWYAGGGPLWQDAARTISAAANDPVRVLDDRSGLGRHAVAASDSARGQVDTYSATGPPSIYLDGLGAQYAVPAGFSFDVADYSVFFSVVRLGGLWTQVLWQPGAASSLAFYIASDGTMACGGLTTATLPLGLSTVALVSRPGGLRIRINGTATAGAAIASAATTGGLLGNWTNDTSNAQVVVSEVILVSRGVTDVEAAKIEAYLSGRRTFVGGYPTDRPLVAYAGNSITGGQSVSNQKLIFTGLAIRSLPTPFVRYSRQAIGGFTTGQLSGVYSTEIAPLYDAARAKNVLVFWELTNDLFNGASGTTAFNNAQSYCQLGRTQGWQGIVVLDCLDRQQTGQPADFTTQRNTVNSSLAAEFTVATANPRVFRRASGSTFPADLLVKVSAITQLQDATNATYYDAPHVHPLDAGHALIAPDLRDALVVLGVSVDTTPPTLASTTIASNGTTWTLAFSEAITGHSGFTVAPSGGAATLAYVSGDGSTSLVFTGSRTVAVGETATISYAPGNVVDIASNPLATISGAPVTNNSTQGGAPFNPQTGVTSATLVEWLDAGTGTFQDAAGATPAVVGTTDPVGRWADQTGLAHHFTTATAGFRPTLRAGANGHPAVRFDGVSNRLTATGFLAALTSGEWFIAQKAILYPQTDVNKVGWVTFGSGGNAFLGYSGFGASNTYDNFGASAANSFAPGTDLSTWHVYNSSAAAGAWTARINGTQVFTTATNTVAWYTTPIIGANSGFQYFLAADVAEILIYNGVLSSGDRASVLAYLRGKYAI